MLFRSISPIVGGRALKGPADRMMRGVGLEPSAHAVAEMYRDFVDVFILDRVDESSAAEIEALGMKCVATNTVMKGREEKEALARATLEALEL